MYSLRRYEQKTVSRVNGLRFAGYVSPVWTKDKWRLVVGMECLAYLDGLVNVTFSEDGLMIRRDPRDEDEFWAWAERGKRRIRK